MQLEEAKKCKTVLLLMSKQVQTQSSELKGECCYPKSSSWYLGSPLKYSLLFVLFQNMSRASTQKNQLDLLNITSNMIVYSHGDRPHEAWLHLDNPLKILGFYLLWSYCWSAIYEDWGWSQAYGLYFHSYKNLRKQRKPCCFFPFSF